MKGVISILVVLHLGTVQAECNGRPVHAACYMEGGKLSNLTGTLDMRQKMTFGCFPTGSMEVLINLKGFDTNDGIRDHGIQVKTYGDTTHGCANTGYTYSADDGHGVQMLGDLGTVDEDVDGTMYTMIKNKKPKLAGQLSIIGRAVVVYDGAFNPHSQNPINAPILGCCVIGLSDGTRWTNPRNTDVIQAASNSGTRSGIHATNPASPSQSSTFHSMPHSSGFQQPASAHQPVTGFHGQQPHSQFNTQHHSPDHSFSGYSHDPHQQPHSQFNTQHSNPAHSFSGYNQAPHQDFGSDFGHSSLFGGGSIGQHQPVFSFGGNSQGQAHSRFNKGGSLGPHIPDFDKAQRTPIYKREEGDIRSPLFGERHKPLFSSSHNSFFPSFDHDTSFDQEKEDVLTSKDKEPEQVPNDAEYAPPDTYSPSSDGGHSSNSGRYSDANSNNGDSNSNGRYSDESSNQDNSNGSGQYSDEGSSGQYSDEGSTQGKYAADGSTQGNSDSSGQYSDDGSTQKNTDSNGHYADESSTRGNSDHSGQYADDGSAEGNSGSSGQYSGIQENTGSTGQHADESSAQGNSDSSGQYADDGSAQDNSDSSGQYSDDGSTQEKSGITGQYADESSDQGNSGSNGQYSDDKNGQYASNDNEESVDNDRSAAYVDGSHGNAHADSTSGSLNDDSSSGSSSYSSSSSSSSGGDLSGVSSGDKADLQNEESSRDDKGIAEENQETQANEGSQGGYIADIDNHGTHEVPGAESASLTTQTDGNENRRTERDPQNTENAHANVIEYPAEDANTSPSEETIRAPEPIISNPAQGNPSGSAVMAVPPPPHLYRSATEHDYPHPPEIQVPHHGGHYESPPLPPPAPSAPHAMQPETTEQTP